MYTTTALETSNLWLMLTDGRCSEVFLYKNFNYDSLTVGQCNDITNILKFNTLTVDYFKQHQLPNFKSVNETPYERLNKMIRCPKNVGRLISEYVDRKKKDTFFTTR